MGQVLKIILADDHHILLDGLRLLLQTQQDMQVVGAYQSGLVLLEELPALGNVDLALLDLSMPVMDGLELSIAIKKKNPDIKIIILSMHDDACNIMKMIDQGVQGYLLKNTDDQELLTAIRKVAEGRLYFSQQVADTIETTILSRQKEADAPPQPKLSTREIEILKLIANELSNGEIAAKLFISERTVETHRKNMLRKMNHKTMVGLLCYALEQKLI